MYQTQVNVEVENETKVEAIKRVKRDGDPYALLMVNHLNMIPRCSTRIINRLNIKLRGNTMEHREYNGWTNYETWNVKLWLDNEQGTYELQKEMAEQANQTPKVDVWTRKDTTRFTLADLLKDYVEECNPLVDDASMYSDLMSAAIQEVNWQEIADAILED